MRPCCWPLWPWTGRILLSSLSRLIWHYNKVDALYLRDLECCWPRQPWIWKALFTIKCCCWPILLNLELVWHCRSLRDYMILTYMTLNLCDPEDHLYIELLKLELVYTVDYLETAWYWYTWPWTCVTPLIIYIMIYCILNLCGIVDQQNIG
jgi:hypothetical protein